MKISLGAAVGIVAMAAVEAVKVNPLPAPVTINWGSSGPIAVDNAFRIIGPAHDVLTKAMARSASLIKRERWEIQGWEHPHAPWPAFPELTKRADIEDKQSSKTIKQFTVQVSDLKADLQLGVDESYTLDVSASGKGTINAKTVWGALHGLHTLEQIIISDGHHGLLIEEPVHVSDKPKYAHRGLMIDTARNFYTLASIYKQIDALAWSKLNVFHWHITDSQSWPVEIKKHPQMAQGGAYSKREIYTQNDIKAVIKYGRERGVRVIPEIDMPGHSAAGWLSVDKKAVACADSWWDNDGWTHHTAVEATPGQLDISYEGTYKLIKDVYGELSKVFTDNVFHVGFDELQKYCYNYSTSAMDWFKTHPKADYHDFTQMYFDKAWPIFNDRPGRRLMMWEDALLSDDISVKLPKNVILQSWNNDVENVKKVASLGYDVVVTSSNFFYLDCGVADFSFNNPAYNIQPLPAMPDALAAVINDPSVDLNGWSATVDQYTGAGLSWCGPYHTWQRIYNYDFTAGLTDTEAKHVIGAEVVLWSEQSDATVVDGKVWPRAAAFAELLWSGNRDADGYKRTTYLSQRLFEFRERLVARGVNAQPIAPKRCLLDPHSCDLFRDQRILGK